MPHATTWTRGNRAQVARLDSRPPLFHRTPLMRAVAVRLGIFSLAACSARPAARSAPVEARAEDAAVAAEPAPDTLTALRLHAPDTLPSPLPDRSNRFADDARAALFGRRLFFDARLSGRLLDGDNDGGEHALGKKGETGKVACAGCHLPAT